MEKGPPASRMAPSRSAGEWLSAIAITSSVPIPIMIPVVITELVTITITITIVAVVVVRVVWVAAVVVTMVYLVSVRTVVSPVLIAMIPIFGQGHSADSHQHR
jgi:hypothetical protein